MLFWVRRLKHRPRVGFAKQSHSIQKTVVERNLTWTTTKNGKWQSIEIVDKLIKTSLSNINVGTQV